MAGFEVTIEESIAQQQRRFIDIGNGTIFDARTGLTWEKKQDCSDGSNPRCVNNVYTLSASGVVPDGTVYTDFLAKTNENTADGISGTNGGPTTVCLGAHCDWRIPNIVELKTILNINAAGTCATNPCINPIFGPTAAETTWSSTTVANLGDGVAAWDVKFHTGFVGGGIKLAAQFVRAVRGGPLP